MVVGWQGSCASGARHAPAIVTRMGRDRARARPSACRSPRPAGVCRRKADASDQSAPVRCAGRLLPRPDGKAHRRGSRLVRGGRRDRAGVVVRGGSEGSSEVAGLGASSVPSLSMSGVLARGSRPARGEIRAGTLRAPPAPSVCVLPGNSRPPRYTPSPPRRCPTCRIRWARLTDVGVSGRSPVARSRSGVKQPVPRYCTLPQYSRFVPLYHFRNTILTGCNM